MSRKRKRKKVAKSTQFIKPSKNKEEKIDRIGLALAILGILFAVAYLLSIIYNAGPGYDRWIGRPFWWK